MRVLRQMCQSTNFQRFSCASISTVCVVASLALLYFCVKNGLGFERHGKMIGDLAMQWRGTLLEYGAFAYGTAMVLNMVVASQFLFTKESEYSAKTALKQLAYSLGSPIVGPFVVGKYLKEHGYEHWDLFCRHTYFFPRS